MAPSLEYLATTTDLLEAWQAGQVCLHPTDTIPGLSFHPGLENAWTRLVKLKKRPGLQTCIALVPTVDDALSWWEPLPEGWELALRRLWPGALSVIWQANSTCPASLVRDDGSLALRVPDLAPEHHWLYQVMERLGRPFPTTSVNSSGEPPCETWQQACGWVTQQKGIVRVPRWVQSENSPSSQPNLPSTLLRIVGLAHQQGYQILRSGSLPTSKIEKALTT
jgi:L-threonylcarbamoyladenylate synthase